MKKVSKRVAQTLAALGIGAEKIIEVIDALDGVEEDRRPAAVQLQLAPADSIGPKLETKVAAVTSKIEKPAKRRKASHEVAYHKRSYPLGRVNLLLQGIVFRGKRDTVSREEFMHRCRRLSIPSAEEFFDRLVSARRLTKIDGNVYRIEPIDALILRRYNEGTTDIHRLSLQTLVSKTKVTEVIGRATAPAKTG